MSKHTPGPWHAVRNKHYWEICSDDFQIGDACASQYTDPGKEEANARLIAAAPDLIEVLRKIHAHGYTNTADHNMVADAIAKATGETQMNYQHMKGPGDLPHPDDPQDEDSFIAERAAELATLPELIEEADIYIEGNQSGEHYTALEIAMADLHSVDPSDLLGSAVLERLYALAKVHGEAREKKVQELAEHKAWCEWTDCQTGQEE